MGKIIVGFNEAEARMPRNGYALIIEGGCYESFNEAEARMPRNVPPWISLFE